MTTTDRRVSDELRVPPKATGERAMTPPVLAPREWEYLRLAALGQRQKEIAQAWGTSISTPKRVGASAIAKLHGESVIDAFRALGWLRVPA